MDQGVLRSVSNLTVGQGDGEIGLPDEILKVGFTTNFTPVVAVGSWCVVRFSSVAITSAATTTPSRIPWHMAAREVVLLGDSYSSVLKSIFELPTDHYDSIHRTPRRSRGERAVTAIAMMVRVVRHDRHPSLLAVAADRVF